MWSAVNSILLMGNDLRTISPSALSILNNPAVIAINQDPLAKPAIRVLRNTNVAKDKYGVGETQVWSGRLAGGDRVVVFLNAADEDMEMTASLEEIFIQETGKAPQVQERWNVHDLWANRMDDATAQNILNTPPGTIAKALQDIDWYNATALPYADGLANSDKRLLGKKIGVIEPKGSLSAMVKRHSAEMFRLRSPNRDVVEENEVRDDLEEKDEL